jgi:DNA-directed RNA polymerase specialized sigma24 family protein
MLPTIENDQAPAPSPDLARAAFRELHARRLHGFALLLVLGDRAHAARLAADALTAAAAQVDALRHPERAAAWLRQQVVRHANGTRPGRGRRPVEPGVLADLGADAGVVAGLALLAPRERAALIASAIERLDRRDVATIVGRDGTALDRILRRARQRYIAGYVAVMPEAVGDGPLTARIHAVTRQTMT